MISARCRFSKMPWNRIPVTKKFTSSFTRFTRGWVRRRKACSTFRSSNDSLAKTRTGIEDYSRSPRRNSKIKDLAKRIPPQRGGCAIQDWRQNAILDAWNLNWIGAALGDAVEA